LVDLGKILPSRFITEVAVGGRLVFTRDAVDLTNLHSPADREDLRWEGLGIDGHGGIGVSP
jgi:hypothetical protein